MVWESFFNTSSGPQYIAETTLVVSTYIMWPFIVGLNLLVISVISVFSELKTPQNILLLSLAVADLMTAVFFIPTYTAFYWTKIEGDVINHERLGSRQDGHNNSLAPYPLDLYAGQLSAIASVDHLFVIALDMFISVIYPLWHHRVVTVRCARNTVIAIWLTILTTVCLPLSDAFVSYFLRLGLDWFTLMLYITVFLTTMAFSFNAVLYHRLRQIKLRYACHKRTCGLTRHRGTSTEKIRPNESATTSVLIFGVFVVMWTPFLVITLSGEHVYDTSVKSSLGILRTVALIVLVANSLADPIIYLKKKRRFKRAYILLLTTSPCSWGKLKLHRLGYVSNYQDSMSNGVRSIRLNGFSSKTTSSVCPKPESLYSRNS